jgi:hypothetical protein
MPPFTFRQIMREREMAVEDPQASAGGAAGATAGRNKKWSNTAVGGAPKKASAAQRIGIGRPP